MTTMDANPILMEWNRLTLDEAADVARSCPMLTLQHGYVEVRLVEDKRAPG